MLIGGGLGWLAVQHTVDGSMARYVVDERTAWLYVAALVGVLCMGALASPRGIAGVAGGLAVGLLVAATATLRPATAAASEGVVDLGPPLAAAAAAALGVAVLSTLHPARDRRHHAHDVRRPWSRRARRQRATLFQARH